MILVLLKIMLMWWIFYICFKKIIMEEKYVALYAQGMVEIWTDYRRTGYPALTPNPDGVNGVNPSGVIPRRWIYPNDEKFSNTANVDAAIARQGGELLDDDMWAFAD